MAPPVDRRVLKKKGKGGKEKEKTEKAKSKKKAKREKEKENVSLRQIQKEEKKKSRELVYATTYKLPPIMAFNVQEKCRFHTGISKLSLPWEGGNPPLTPSPAQSLLSLAPPPPPPVDNPGWPTVTGMIAKGHKGPCSPLIGVKEIF